MSTSKSINEGSLFPWIAWSIWIARNQKIFQSRSFTAQETITKDTHDAFEWISAQTKAIRIDRLIRGLTEDTSNLRCFSDVEWRAKSNIAGLGWLLKDQHDRIVARGSRVKTQIGSVLMAKVVAMREVVTKASLMNISGFFMNSDSQQLIQLLKKNKSHLEIYAIMQDILKFACDFEIFFVFIPRSKNEEVDSYAKSALNVVPTDRVNQPV